MFDFVNQKQGTDVYSHHFIYWSSCQCNETSRKKRRRNLHILGKDVLDRTQKVFTLKGKQMIHWILTKLNFFLFKLPLGKKKASYKLRETICITYI